MNSTPTNAEIQSLYDWLWASALAAYERGKVRADPFLRDKAADHRGGLTLVARCSNPAILEFADSLRDLLPEQYIYHPAEIHVTVLTLVPVFDGFDLKAIPIDRYKSVFETGFQGAAAFDIHFRGVTASHEAVMIQGFPDPILNELREVLRPTLKAEGLGDDLDVRYKINAAHMTVMRYKSIPTDLAGLRYYLEYHRKTDFGTVTVNQLEFVENDYFLSHDKTKILASYRLE